jgi:hypothetical protein
MPLLRASGRRVASAQLPPISITDGTAEVHRLLARVGGPVSSQRAATYRAARSAAWTTGKSICARGNMVEVVGEDVHGDRGDDLDDLLIATPASSLRSWAGDPARSQP